MSARVRESESARERECERARAGPLGRGQPGRVPCEYDSHAIAHRYRSDLV
jgi:hypothetical protein